MTSFACLRPGIRTIGRTYWNNLPSSEPWLSPDGSSEETEPPETKEF
jgi:hypothetical protein